MKVYVVALYFPYEGYSEPQAVFDSKEKAEKYVEDNKDDYFACKIFEQEVK